VPIPIKEPIVLSTFSFFSVFMGVCGLQPKVMWSTFGSKNKVRKV